MRAVLDTNVWLSVFLTANPDSAARLIWNSWRKGIFEAVVTQTIVNEIADKLAVFKYDPHDINEFVEILLAFSKNVPIEHQVMGCHDPKDDPFIETAINGGAQYLVTRDKRLLNLAHHVDTYVKIRGVTILRDARSEIGEVDFCSILRSQPGFEIAGLL